MLLLMMQKELSALLKVRDETNRKIRTAKVAIQLFNGSKSRLGAQKKPNKLVQSIRLLRQSVVQASHVRELL
jgi:hypothetical protein